MMKDDDPVRRVLGMIKALGPSTVAAYCEYESYDRAKDAAGWLTENDADFLSLAESRRAIVATVKMRDGAVLIFGGLLSSGHISRTYEALLNAVRPVKSSLAIAPLSASGSRGAPDEMMDSGREAGRKWWQVWK